MCLKPPAAHPVFELWKSPDADHSADVELEYPGVLRRLEFVATSIANCPGIRSPGVDAPPVDDQYFEWIDVLESVTSADARFCMAELGAGYGRWLVRAAVALRQLRPDVSFHAIAVEAEPTHFAWLNVHFRDNGLDPEEHRLVEAAVDARDGEAFFTVGEASEWYGQAVVPRGTEGYSLARVRTVSLATLLDGIECVDLMDLDVQGAELRVLDSGIEEVNRKVKRVHIGTHSQEIEVGLRELFGRHGWTKRYDFRMGCTEMTPFGEVDFADGVQTWINPAYERR